ncbi:hypothetical protein S83_051066, partial [Arachis hypogaea]
MKPSDVIQCRECGYCILYKKRTRRIYVMCCSWTPNFSMRENVHFVWMLKPSDVIQCRECGYCILYKKRTHRIYVMCCSWTLNFSMRENVHFVWM